VKRSGEKFPPPESGGRVPSADEVVIRGTNRDEVKPRTGFSEIGCGFQGDGGKCCQKGERLKLQPRKESWNYQAKKLNEGKKKGGEKTPNS